MTATQIHQLGQGPIILPSPDAPKLRKTAQSFSSYLRHGWHDLATVVVSTATLVSFILVAVSLISVALIARIPAAIHERLTTY